MKWEEVIKDSRYQESNVATQDRIKESWYDSNIKADPRYTHDLDRTIRKDLFREEPKAFRGVGASGDWGKPLMSKAADVIYGKDKLEQYLTQDKPFDKPLANVPLIKTAEAGIEIFKQTYGRLFGGFQALLAGKSPLEGIIKPQEQARVIDSVIASKFATRMGVPEYDVMGQTLVNGLAGWALELAGIHLLFGVVPKAIGKAVRGARATYTTAQGKALDEFKSALSFELEAAGMAKEVVKSQVDILTYQQWVKTGILHKTPGALRKTTAVLNTNKGKLGEFIKGKLGEASAQATEKGFSPAVMKRITKAQGLDPETSFGHMIKTQILAKEAIPLHPAEAGREALKALYPKAPVKIGKGGFVTPELDVLDLGPMHGIAKKGRIGVNKRLSTEQNRAAIRHELGHVIEKQFNIKDNPKVVSEFKMTKDVQAKSMNRDEAVAEAINQIILNNKEVIKKHPALVELLRSKVPNLKAVLFDLDKQLVALRKAPVSSKVELMKPIAQEAKKYKTAEEFVRKTANIQVNGTSRGNEIVRLFPKDTMRGKGITTNELFVQLNKTANRTGSDKVFASGINDKAMSFYESLQDKGLLKNFNKTTTESGTLAFTAELTNKAKQITQSQLTDIWKQAQESVVPKEARIQSIEVLDTKSAKELFNVDASGNPIGNSLIKITSTTGKKNPTKTIGQEPTQTGLENLRVQTALEIVNLSKEHNIGITITGGTEHGIHIKGKYGHENGYKVDIGLEPKLNAVIESFRYGGKLDGDKFFINPKTGSWYRREKDHWDVEVGTTRTLDSLRSDAVNIKEARRPEIKRAHKTWLEDKKTVTPKELINNPSLVDTVNAFPGDSDPATLALAKEIKTEIVPQVVKDIPVKTLPEYEPEAWFHTNYKTPAGIKSTLIKGSELNYIKAGLKAGEIPNDSNGVPIISLVEVSPMSGRKAELNLRALDDTICYLDGIKQEKVAWWSHFAKKFGTPFMIGEKYPPFGKVYKAIRDSFDYGHEVTLVGHQILDKKFILSLPPANQQRVVDALMLGNIEGRVIQATELKEVFKFNDNEIKAFKKIRALLDYDTKAIIAKRKLVSGYDKLDAKDKALADTHIQEQVNKIPGYMPHSRIGGKWAVYKEELDPMHPNHPYFFDLYANKLAARDAAIEQGGTLKDNVYLRSELTPEIHGRMTVTDLENLADSAGIDPDSPDLEAILKVIREKSFQSHWIKRKNIPKSAWNMDSVIKSVVNYHHGAASGLSRAKGRLGADRALIENLNKMDPALKKYASEFISGVFDTGNIGIHTLQELMFLWEIALKPKQLGQNATQVWANTFPAMCKYYGIRDASKVILKSYDLAGRYAMFKVDGKRHGLSTELFGYLKKLDRQGKLGEQMTMYLLDSSDLKATFNKMTSASMRLGEFVNRTTTYIAARFAAMEKLKLTDKNSIISFGKTISGRTQFDYAKYNLPTIITGAGNIRDFTKTMYIFRHFQASNLGRIAQMTPWRGAKWKEYTTGLGNALLMHGWRGLPFMGVLGVLWKMATGRVLETDVIETMQEAGIPGKAIDVATFGVPALDDADVSRLIGMGDAFPIHGDPAEKLFGAVYGKLGSAMRAWEYLQRGDTLRALELISPGILRDIQKGFRYLREGVRKSNGKLIATPSTMDCIKTMFGIPLVSVAKAWLAEESKTTLKTSLMDKTRIVHQQLAEAIATKNEAKKKRIRAMIKKYNEKVAPERRIIINFQSILANLYKRKGVETPPLKMRRRFQEIDRIYDVNKGERR